MFEEQATKVKITSVVILVGMSAMLAAVVTDHWAVLSPRVEKLNATCEAAHFGLWRLCKKSIFIVEEDPQGKGCGPISLPGGTVAASSYSLFCVSVFISNVFGWKVIVADLWFLLLGDRKINLNFLAMQK